MRLLVDPRRQNGLSRGLVAGFLLFCALLLAAWAGQRVLSGGLSPSGVEEHYLGPPDFPEPIPAAALWEEFHANAFVYGLLVLMLGSLLAASALGPRTRAALVGSLFASTLCDLLAPLAIWAAGSGGALRVATFLATALALASATLATALRYGRPGPDEAP